MIKRIFYILLFFIIGSIIYLNFIGISTSKLNKIIQTEIRDKYPQINLKLNDIKILLNISTLSIDLLELKEKLCGTSKVDFNIVPGIGFRFL